MQERHLNGFVESIRSEFESVLGEWVGIPTISASPEHARDIRRCAAAAHGYLAGLGADAEIVETPGNPVVLARFVKGPDRPTVTIYNHLDVQPAGELEWTHDPFAMDM